jgi:transposase
MPPAYVKAYVKRNKNDVADVEAVCEVVTRPTMRFVPITAHRMVAEFVVHQSLRE